MKNIFKKNSFLVIAAIVLFIVFVFVSFRILSGNFGLSSPSTDDFDTYNNEIVPGVIEEDDPVAIKQSRQSGLVYEMAQGLPYEGVNFSLFYSFDDDFFTLYLNPNNTVGGNNEFEKYLKSNGVENSSWIPNLNTVYQKPTQ